MCHVATLCAVRTQSLDGCCIWPTDCYHQSGKVLGNIVKAAIEFCGNCVQALGTTLNAPCSFAVHSTHGAFGARHAQNNWQPRNAPASAEQVSWCQTCRLFLWLYLANRVVFMPLAAPLHMHGVTTLSTLAMQLTNKPTYAVYVSQLLLKCNRIHLQVNVCVLPQLYERSKPLQMLSDHAAIIRPTHVKAAAAAAPFQMRCHIN
jgi:hypothetical protein